MTDRFDSGLSISQAKKDAKKLAKAKDIPLHEALDIIAIENAGLSWNKAMYRVNGVSEVGTISCRLARFVFSIHKVSESNDVECFLSKQTPVALINGMSGSGKTVAALCLAEQHVQKKHKVFYLPGYDMPRNKTPYPGDIGHQKALDMMSRYPGYFQVIDGDNPSTIEKLDLVPNALVVIDEVWMFSRKGDIGDALNTVFDKGAGIIAVGQSIHDNDFIPPEKVAFWLCGKMASHFYELEGLPRIIVETKSRVGVSGKLESIFVLVDSGLSAIVRFPNPINVADEAG
ncbi:MAG: hypothetical protein AB2669_08150 [Candidatus Thiodiazotropha endolucinida]|nr:hypothetical protein [Candidatus Thiodiazotropha taylori]MCW4251014.1 hypothetical protein [Candidatus Thiodiazotropha endolucinida]MCG8042518.1 hypothetical protein [Candidatus Thiodiazotropha taylori]MCG8120547.1 hypothetical protein [Candidatus Thiodiazotropha taylori]MCW4296238.1 hypothetical protein [Candidatus Thiodiazotropha endolucinida]